MGSRKPVGFQILLESGGVRVQSRNLFSKRLKSTQNICCLKKACMVGFHLQRRQHCSVFKPYRAERIRTSDQIMLILPKQTQNKPAQNAGVPMNLNHRSNRLIFLPDGGCNDGHALARVKLGKILRVRPQ